MMIKLFDLICEEKHFSDINLYVKMVVAELKKQNPNLASKLWNDSRYDKYIKYTFNKKIEPEEVASKINSISISVG